MSFYSDDLNSLWFSNCCVPLIRFWGIFTALVTCGAGVDVLISHHLMGIYIIVVSFIVLFLEITWAITIFFKACVHNVNNKIFHVWNIILKINFWKKSIIYCGFSVTLLLKTQDMWLSYVAAAMLLTLAFFHLILCFQKNKKCKGKESLLQNEDHCHDRNGKAIFEVLQNSVKPKAEISVEDPGGNVLAI